MSSAFCSRSSISKQRGAEISSRLMPPKAGEMALTMVTISSTSLVARQSGHASTPANSLKMSALPSITGWAPFRADVAEAEHGRAVGDHGHGVLLHRQRVGFFGIVMDGHAHAGHPGVYAIGQVVARLDRDLALDLDLAAEVHEERAVRDVDDLDAPDRLQALDHLLPVPLVARLEGEVTDDRLLTDFDQIDRADVAAGLADRGGNFTQHPRLVLDLEPDRERVTRRRSVAHLPPPCV